MIYFKLHSQDMYAKQSDFGTIQVVGGGFVQARSGWRHKRRFMERYELIYTWKGALYLTLSNTPLTLLRNQLLLLPPFVTLEGSRVSEEEVAFYWVDFDADRLQDINALPLMQPFDLAHHNELQSLMSILCEALISDTARSDVKEAMMMAVLYMAGNGRRRKAGTDISGRIQEFVESHLDEPLTAQSVADHMNYNKDYLNRIVKNAIGFTLKEYIDHRKMESARALLRTSAYSINDISRFLGYSDSNLFTKFFTYHQHVSPSEYRNGFEL